MPGSLLSRRGAPVGDKRFSTRFWMTAIGGFAVILSIAVYLGSAGHSVHTQQTVGNAGILAFSLLGTVACAWAARRRGLRLAVGL